VKTAGHKRCLARLDPRGNGTELIRERPQQ
jgi:hypothetical protein